MFHSELHEHIILPCLLWATFHGRGSLIGHNIPLRPLQCKVDCRSSCWFLACSWYFKDSSVAKTVNAGCRFALDCTSVLYMLVIFGEPERWGIKLLGLKLDFCSEKNSCILFGIKFLCCVFRQEQKQIYLKKKLEWIPFTLLSFTCGENFGIWNLE